MFIKSKLLLALVLASFIFKPQYGLASQIDKIELGGWQVSTNEGSIFNNFSSSDVYGYNKNSSFSASLGYRPSSIKRLRVATEFFVRQKSVSNSISLGSKTVNRAAFMANAFYNFASVFGAKPYIGIGMGLSYFGVRMPDGLGVDGEDSISPAYQVMTGFSYVPEKFPATSLHFGYRYFQALHTTESYSYNNVEEDLLSDPASHSIEGRIKFEF